MLEVLQSISRDKQISGVCSHKFEFIMDVVEINLNMRKYKPNIGGVENEKPF